MGDPYMSMFHGATVHHISGGNFQISGLTATDYARRLLAQNIAPNALPDSAAMYDGPKCYPETRKALRSKLQRWIRGEDDIGTKLMWLHGGAGAGKSAILRSIALGDDEDAGRGPITGAPRVLGSFFFSRTDHTRNTAQPLIPTLASQLCNVHPEAREIILQSIVENQEFIFSTSAPNQVRTLLVNPLWCLELFYAWLSPFVQGVDLTQPGRVFIIDGLDECDPKRQAEVIEAIALLVQDLPVRVLLASRPDEPIPSAIRNNSALRGVYSEICLSNDPDSSSDIRLFLEESLREVRMRYISLGYGSLPDPWPMRADIDELVDKSSGHFIYASTVEKYISSGVELPNIALRVILGLQVPRTGRPFEVLDALYRYILGKARFQKEVLDIISWVMLFEPSATVDTVSDRLGHPPCDIHHFLSDMSALVIIEGMFFDTIHWRHKSFEDFLQDKARAQEFYLGTEAQFHFNHLEHYFTQLRLAASNKKWDLHWLVESIVAGINAFPLSDATTGLIIQHPLQDVYNFLDQSSLCPDETCAKYIRGIAQYGFVNSCTVYENSLKDFIYHCKETPDLPDPDNNLDLGSIFIPLLLVGYDVDALTSIYWLTGAKGKLWAILIAFTNEDIDCICRLHRHPVHILHQIREEMVDADNNLEAAALKVLRMVTKSPGQFEGFKDYYRKRGWFCEAAVALLEAVAFVLPKVAYRHDIAFYAASQLPDPLDIDGHPMFYNLDSRERTIRRVRKAMDTYLRRGVHPAIGANTGNSEIDSGTEEVDSGSDEEEIWKYPRYKDASEADCRICKKIRGEEIE